MLKNTYIILVLTVCYINSINGQLRTPALSPSAKIIQTVGLTDIQIEYSRPSLRGRTLFGTEGIIPFNEFWRTGANAATKITIGDDILINNQVLKKGTYSILTKPNNTSWGIYFYRYESGNWNTYVTKEPTVSITQRSQKITDKVETFTIALEELSMNSSKLTFSWENTKVSIPMLIKNEEKVLSNIKKVLSGPSDFDYFRSALYLHEAQLDLETALEYIQKVTQSENPRFFQVYREALILQDLGRKKEAITVAKKSLELSKKSKNGDFIRLNQKLIKRLSE
ncbi:hypothetical protein AB832_04895 [Flavobacteriaceae bacterium (ex Bugula neritina AB1)]|nr:hypothetical protein AB832_04895 [Flavobacteriaceae bacterium (ex Bugula neritina AB1)]